MHVCRLVRMTPGRCGRLVPVKINMPCNVYLCTVMTVKTDKILSTAVICRPGFRGGTRARAPPDGPQVNFFVYPLFAFLPIFLCLAGHKTKGKAYL